LLQTAEVVHRAGGGVLVVLVGVGVGVVVVVLGVGVVVVVLGVGVVGRVVALVLGVGTGVGRERPGVKVRSTQYWLACQLLVGKAVLVPNL
jgi:hypothetical protein